MFPILKLKPSELEEIRYWLASDVLQVILRVIILMIRRDQEWSSILSRGNSSINAFEALDVVLLMTTWLQFHKLEAPSDRISYARKLVIDPLAVLDPTRMGGAVLRLMILGAPEDAYAQSV